MSLWIPWTPQLWTRNITTSGYLLTTRVLIGTSRAWFRCGTRLVLGSLASLLKQSAARASTRLHNLGELFFGVSCAASVVSPCASLWWLISCRHLHKVSTRQCCLREFIVQCLCIESTNWIFFISSPHLCTAVRGWMFFYTVAFPVYKFFLSLHLFWKMYDFSRRSKGIWQKMIVVCVSRLSFGNDIDRWRGIQDESKFDPLSSIPLKSWSDNVFNHLLIVCVGKRALG